MSRQLGPPGPRGPTPPPPGSFSPACARPKPGRRSGTPSAAGSTGDNGALVSWCLCRFILGGHGVSFLGSLLPGPSSP